jgi:pteridine reductase
MNEKALNGKTILITGAAKRVGRLFALACAGAGADIVIHHGHSQSDALQVKDQIEALGQHAWILDSDFAKPAGAAQLISLANEFSPLYALVNSASVFEALSFSETTQEDWERHLAVNLTTPFLLGQAFAKQVPETGQGRIVNIVDWRALRPGADHFPYTISKAALAALTQSMAVALAPRITVNALALGAILPPSDGGANNNILKNIPARRWSEPKEVEEALLFLLTGPAYITGEIIHVDGGRHLI